MQRRDFLIGAAAGAMGATAPALAFEKVGDRRMMVFSGGQPVPVLDPHVRYDWSTRMMQQAIYDALCKYELSASMKGIRRKLSPGSPKAGKPAPTG
jgi:peptide/nickel transport system substrate-binding protein